MVGRYLFFRKKEQTEKTLRIFVWIERLLLSMTQQITSRFLKGKIIFLRC